jgi:hypothetical protein
MGFAAGETILVFAEEAIFRATLAVDAERGDLAIGGAENRGGCQFFLQHLEFFVGVVSDRSREFWFFLLHQIDE